MALPTMDTMYIASGLCTAIVAMAGFIVWLVKIVIKVSKDSIKVNTELKSSIDNNTKVTERVFDHLVNKRL